jgi:uncharacterized protein
VPSRRKFIQYLSSSACAASLTLWPQRSPATNLSPLGFEGLAHGTDRHHHLPPGYSAQVLLRWGDLLSGEESDWHPRSMDAEEQNRRFGYNNDFVAFMPLPLGSMGSDHGLLCVNHEYTNPTFMWPGLNRITIHGAMTRERTAIEMAAVGHSVVEIARHDGKWSVVDGAYNRRITADTLVKLSGPAAGSPRLQTRADPQGRTCRGVLNPCSGGKTPWGTVLMAEENFNFVFHGAATDPAEQRNHQRYGVGSRSAYRWWSRHFPRFDLGHEPREANRFGWVVELDPHTPGSNPVKRTALGRFKHEAATVVLNPDGRVVVYTADDQAFEYLYRFVSSGVYAPNDRASNTHLLDDGTLFVARLHNDNTLQWLPLRHGEGPLTNANGFRDQADVLIETRRAADLLGATKLDRPEDVETNPRDGLVYALLTNNQSRHADALDAANPRSRNTFGHILRLRPPGAPGDVVEHAADSFDWEIFALAGNPAEPSQNARYPGTTGDGGWFAAPDNCAFDPAGRLWIASDQGRNWRATGFADGLWGCAANAAGEYDFRRFFRAPVGAEVCGPEFTADGRNLFLAIQHPGVDGLVGSSYDNPATRWPDFDAELPPRPSLLVVTRDDGGVIGD